MEEWKGHTHTTARDRPTNCTIARHRGHVHIIHQVLPPNPYPFHFTTVQQHTQGMSLVVLVFMPKVLAALAYGFLWAAGWNPLDNTDPKRPQVRRRG